MALRNPLLDFDTILFVTGAPGRFPHLSDQHYGWWSVPGGGAFCYNSSWKRAWARPAAAGLAASGG